MAHSTHTTGAGTREVSTWLTALAVALAALTLLHARGADAQVVLIAEGSSGWLYDDSGSDNGGAGTWGAIAYDDSGWSSGTAQLGYGDGDEQTVVSYGGDPNNKHITTYFRHDFTYDGVGDLKLRFLRDDAIVVHLNGVEIARDNIGASYNWQTTASATVGGAAEDEFNTVVPNAATVNSVIVTGTNVLAVEIHQRSDSSSDISFDLELSLIITETLLSAGSVPTPYGGQEFDHSVTMENLDSAGVASTFVQNYNPAKVVYLSSTPPSGWSCSHASPQVSCTGTIPAVGVQDMVISYRVNASSSIEFESRLTPTLGNVANNFLNTTVLVEELCTKQIVASATQWKYYPNAGEPTGWTLPSAEYDDSGWTSAAAPLGFGGLGEVTTLPDTSRTAYYFRYTTTVYAVDAGLFLSMHADDGAIVYLNGVEAWRRNMPNGPVDISTSAMYDVSGEAEDLFAFEIAPSSLIPLGAELVIAVEVHQYSGSTDLIFDFNLVTSGCDARLCYSVSDGNDQLVSINTWGNFFDIGPLGVANVEAIAFDPDRTTLYGANADRLGTIDLQTGVFTNAASTFGTGGGAEGNIGFTDIDGLAWDVSDPNPSNYMFYGTHRRSGENDLLIQINPTTGAHVPNAFSGGTADYVVIGDIGGSQKDIDDIAVDPTDGQMYAILNGGGNDDHIVKVDKLTGAVEDVGSLQINDVEGLTFHDSGAFLGTTGNTAANGDNDSLWLISKTNGDARLLKQLDRYTDYEASACLTGNIVQEADLYTEIVCTPPNFPQVGANLPFHVVTGNLGPWLGSVTTIDIQLPAGVTYVDAEPMQGDCTEVVTNLIRCDLGTLQNGDTVVVNINTVIDNTDVPLEATSTVYTVPSAVTASVTDPDLTNNNSTHSVFRMCQNPELVFGTGASWRYMDSGNDPGSWLDGGFSLGALSQGNGPLGYNNAGLGTTVGFGGNGNNKHPTTHFIREFTISIADPALFVGAIINLLRDDGAIVYVNGVEVDRQRMGAGVVSYTDFAASREQITFLEQFYFPIMVDASYFVDGTNRIQVETHIFTPAEPDLSFDASLYLIHACNAEIGDYVWDDLNANGVQDGGESGVQGVAVAIYDIDNGMALVDTDTTDVDGLYLFDTITRGNYEVRFTVPGGYEISPQGVGSGSTDSDVDASGIVTGISIDFGELNYGIDAGIYQEVVLGDYVWIDANADGIQDGGESGYDGATVNLLDGSATFVASTTTASDGSFSFSVVPGTYMLELVLPSGYQLSDVGQTTGSLDSDFSTSTLRTATVVLQSGDSDLDLDAGIYEFATVGNYVWEDKDFDGRQDGNEDGIPFAQVQLLDVFDAVVDTVSTDGSGFYQFTNLEPATYSIQFFKTNSSMVFTTQNGIGDTSIDSDADTSTGQTAQFALASGETNLDIDAGLYIPCRVGDRFWLDTNGNGLQDVGESGVPAGVVVELFEELNPVPIDTTTTDANGKYLFSGIAPGSYFVRFLDAAPPAGLAFTEQYVGSDPNIDSDAGAGRTSGLFTLTSGDYKRNVDAGIYTECSVGDFIWEDLNANGVLEAGDDEVGSAGHLVELFDFATGSGVLVSSFTTVDGSYLFSGLRPSTYYVKLTPAAGFHLSPADQQANDLLDSDFQPNGETATFVLLSGDVDLSIDGGVYRYASIGDLVWEDKRGDGVYEFAAPLSETGKSGVAVELYDDTLTQIDSTTTDGSGVYGFSDIVPGTYYVRFIATGDFVFSAADQTSDTLDSDAAADGFTGAYVLESGQTVTSVDAGMYEPVSIGDYVFEDVNGDGVQDGGDVGIGGVNVELLDSSDTVIATATTSASTGLYLFADVPGDDYHVHFDLPGGYVFTSANVGSDAVDSDANVVTGDTAEVAIYSGAGSVLTFDAGMLQLSTVGDYVFEDVDGDSVYSAGDANLAGVLVELRDAGDNSLVNSMTTPSSGAYQFAGVYPGSYYVVFSLNSFSFARKDRGGDDALDSDADPVSGATDVFVVSSGDAIDTIDAGLYVPAVLGNFVWEDMNADGVQDIGELGIEDVVLDLYRIHENGTEKYVAQDTTSAAGAYGFASLRPGSYRVEIAATSMEVSPADAGGDSVDSDFDDVSLSTGTIGLDSGEVDNTVDLGMYTLATLGDTVWIDANGDGVQNDAAFVSDMLVELYTEGDVLVDSDTTDAAGQYQFSVAPGRYYVRFVPSGLYVITAQNIGDGSTDSDANPVVGIDYGKSAVVELASGDAVNTIDCGLYVPCSLGDFAFVDDNGDGLMSGDAGLAGVFVELLDVNTIAVDSFTTLSGGAYSFTNIVPGVYTVRFTPPGAFVVTAQDQGDDALDSDPSAATRVTGSIVLSSGDAVTNVDAGFYEPVSVGDLVFLDANANGEQESEVGVSGVQVDLLDDVGGLITSVSTGGSGDYVFSGLAPGDYSLRFLAAASGYEISPAGQGGDASLDSDADVSTGLVSFTATSGVSRTDLDCGVYNFASVGDTAFDDLNGNGIYDFGDGEIGIQNVFVELRTNAGGSPGVLVSSDTTDGNGNYAFSSVVPGEYIVVFGLPPTFGYQYTLQNVGTPASDSNVDTTTGETAVLVLASGDVDNTIDAGYFRPSLIGDTVWWDQNGDGVYQVAEPGVENVLVELLDASEILLTSVTTNENGTYVFTNLAPATYRLRFTPPVEYGFVPLGSGSDTSLDSDVAPSTGLTAQYVITPGLSRDDIDAGLFINSGVAGVAWLDDNGDGVRDGGEAFIANIDVDLFTSGGSPVASLFTNSSGAYYFEGVIPGNYYVTFNSAPYAITIANQGSDATDSDANQGSGSTAVFSVPSGTVVQNIDIGMYVLSSIGDYAFVDADGNGVQDGGEAALSGVGVELRADSAGGALLATDTTDALGAYGFGGLAPGDYVLVFSAPGAHVLTAVGQGGDGALDSDADPASGGATAVITLTSATDRTDIDVGAYIPATIGDTVFVDGDGDGIFDLSELGYGGGVSVTLHRAADDVQVGAAATTDGGGQYAFTGVAPGDYYVQFNTPAGAVFSPALQGGDASEDSDANEATGRSGTVTAVSGETIDDVDAGVYFPASIGNFVFLDDNGDGVDGGEAGVDAISVRLLDAALAELATTSTSAGVYGFAGLAPGVYYVDFELSGAYEHTAANAGGDDTVDSDANAGTGVAGPYTLASGDANVDVDAGLYEPGDISGVVFEDRLGDGTSSGDPLIFPAFVELLRSSVVIDSLTTTDGAFAFVNLVPGAYAVRMTPDSAYSTTSKDTGGDDTVDSDVDVSGKTDLIALSSGESVTNVDGGFVILGALGDFVFVDANGDGVQNLADTGLGGVALELLNANNVSIDSTTSSGLGAYGFSDIFPGTYTVAVSPPGSFVPTLRNVGGNAAVDSDIAAGGSIVGIVIESGETDLMLDAGLYEPAAISGLVWEEYDVDGLFSSETLVEGVAVNLRNDADDSLVGSVLTLADGTYTFSVPPGSYYVEVLLPINYEFTPFVLQGNDTTIDSDVDDQSGFTASVTVSSGDIVGDIDAGIYDPSKYAILAGVAWNDIDFDGLRQFGEARYTNIVVDLRAGGSIVRSTSTDSNGEYIFRFLHPDDYIVEFAVTSLFFISEKHVGTNTTVDSDADDVTGVTDTITLAAGDVERNIDVGMIPQALGVGLSGLVFEDSNFDGVRSPSEPRIGGVSVALLDDGGFGLGATTTDVDGYYEFVNLVPGDYSVVFGNVAGHFVTTQGVGGNGTVDSDADTGDKSVFVTLGVGENKRHLDMGVYKLVSWAGQVWDDLNNDGVFSLGSEPFVNGVTVELILDGAAVQQTTTAVDGTISIMMRVRSNPSDSVGDDDVSSSTGALIMANGVK